MTDLAIFNLLRVWALFTIAFGFETIAAVKLLPCELWNSGCRGILAQGSTFDLSSPFVFPDLHRYSCPSMTIKTTISIASMTSAINTDCHEEEMRDVKRLQVPPNKKRCW